MHLPLLELEDALTIIVPPPPPPTSADSAAVTS